MNTFRLLVWGLILLLASCGKKPESSTEKVMTVSILPQKYFVEQLAGNHYEINVMIPPGANPVSYDPSPKQMKLVSQSDAYLRIGHLAFEKAWLPKIKSLNPELKMLDQSLNVNLIKDTKHSHHGDSHEHHDGIDPHIWTSPKSVKKQIEVIYNYLVEIDPDNNLFYRKNYLRFMQRVDSLDLYASESFKDFKDRTFLIFHPSLSYLARDYNLNQVPIEIEGKEPSPVVLTQVLDTARKHDIHTVFIQKQFNTSSAETIAREIDGKVVTINPLEYDWYSGTKDIVDKLSESMKQ